jgi:hypothetical protein
MAVSRKKISPTPVPSNISETQPVVGLNKRIRVVVFYLNTIFSPIRILNYVKFENIVATTGAIEYDNCRVGNKLNWLFEVPMPMGHNDCEQTIKCRRIHAKQSGIQAEHLNITLIFL